MNFQVRLALVNFFKSTALLCRSLICWKIAELLKNLDQATKNASTDVDTLKQATEQLVEQGIVQGPLDNILTIRQHLSNNAGLYEGDRSGTVEAIKRSCSIRIVVAEVMGERSTDPNFNQDELKRWCQESDGARVTVMLLPPRRSVIAGNAAKTRFANSLSDADVNDLQSRLDSGSLSEAATKVTLLSGKEISIDKAGVTELLSMVGSTEGTNGSAHSCVTQ
jgi:hypothetical protein